LTQGRFGERASWFDKPVRQDAPTSWYEMIKQFLLLLGVIAVILAALLCSLYILDLVKMADLQTDLRKILGLVGVAAVAGVLITLLMRAAQKK
jgi:cytochrome bd-type quinol oxidase subunit 2